MAGCKFRRQEIIEPYIVDFVYLERKLVIELDGGQHVEQMEDDAKRTAFIESKGYKVIRFWNNEIIMNTQPVLEQLQNYLIYISSPPQEHFLASTRGAQPSPGGRGV